MPIDFAITTGGSPIFRQIVDQVRLAVSMGKLSAGEPLPSVRALAEQLVVNPNTVAKAYAELAGEGTIETHPGRGVFIGDRRQRFTKSERNRRLRPHVDALVTEGLSLGFTVKELSDALIARATELQVEAKS